MEVEHVLDPVTTGPGARTRWRQGFIKTRALLKAQRWWRRSVSLGNTTELIMRDFKENGVDCDIAARIGFVNLSAMIRKPGLQRAMRRTVNRVFYLSYGRRGTKRIVTSNLHVRVFLAAYTIWYYRNNVFEAATDALELETRALARPMLEVFHGICDRLHGFYSGHGTGDRNALVSPDFVDHFGNFVVKFKEWKIGDEKKICARIEHALVSLYDGEKLLADEGTESEEVLEEMRLRQQAMRYKLLQVGGVEALRAVDARSGHLHLPIPTCNPMENPAVNHAANAAVLRTGREASAVSLMPVSLSSMTKEKLAYELVLDPGYTIGGDVDDEDDNSCFAKLRRTYLKAFWNSLVRDLRAAPPDFTRVLRVLREIRDGCAELGCDTEAADSIRAILNTEAIDADVSGGRISWAGSVRLVEGVVGVVKKMQAPRRDAATAEKWGVVRAALSDASSATDQQPVAFCQALEFIIGCISTIRLDAANARLRAVSEEMQVHGVEHMRRAFERDLQAGRVTVHRSERWMADGVRREVESGRVDIRDLKESRDVSFKLVHAGAVLCLITADRFDPETFPELLRLEFDRIQKAHAEFRLSVMALTTLLELDSRRGFAGDRPMVAVLAAPLAGFFAKYKPFLWDAEHVRVSLRRHLDGEGVSPDAQEFLEGVLRKVVFSEGEHVLYKACREKIRKIWFNEVSPAVSVGLNTGSVNVPTGGMRTGFAHKGSRSAVLSGIVSAAFTSRGFHPSRDHSALPQITSELMDGIAARTRDIFRVIALNAVMHMPRYIQMIRDCVGAMEAA